MHFVVRWPDRTVEACYSPSLVIREHFTVGHTYTLAEFVNRSRTALTLASERVREKYGFACSRSLGQLSAIEVRARAFAADPEASVTIEAFEQT